MNICMFTNTYLPQVGGVARSVASYAEDMRKMGHRVLIVAPTYAEEVRGERDDEVLRVPAIQRFNGSDFSMRIAVPFLIANRIDDFCPDIIHSHHPYLLGDAAMRTARRRNLPLVFTHHTLYEQYAHYVPVKSDVMQQFVISLSTQYANLCQRVVAPSESIARLLRSRGVMSPIEEIPTGVDLNFFRNGNGSKFRQAYAIDPEERVIGHVGRLAPEKNLCYLAEAVASFLDYHKGIFLVVGAGPSKEKIRRIFHRHRLEKRLITTGECSGRYLADAYSAMDLFVFASKSETQGMVLTEAMAAGKPVIALDASGVREVVTDRVNGRLLDAESPDKLFAEAIHDFFHNPELAGQFSLEALKTAGTLSRESCAERMASVYESMLLEYRRASGTLQDFLDLYKVVRSINVEWKLISGKVAATVNALIETGGKQ